MFLVECYRASECPSACALDMVSLRHPPLNLDKETPDREREGASQINTVRFSGAPKLYEYL